MAAFFDLIEAGMIPRGQNDGQPLSGRLLSQNHSIETAPQMDVDDGDIDGRIACQSRPHLGSCCRHGEVITFGGKYVAQKFSDALFILDNQYFADLFHVSNALAQQTLRTDLSVFSIVAMW